MRISEHDRQRALTAVAAVRRGDDRAYNAEVNASIRDGGFLRFAYALAELAKDTE